MKTELISELEIRDLCVSVENKRILNGINLRVRQGEIHALMGPNGSGKSTLAMTIMGFPKFKITSGEILFNGKNVQEMLPHERARAGLFLSFQYPSEVPGVNMLSFLRNALNAKRETPISVQDFQKLVKEKSELLKIDESFISRALNVGFSGGEKKRSEIFQLAVLEPKIAMLDETDSGLDIDTLKTVAKGIKQISGPNIGILLITHYQRILNYITPHYVHVMIDGRIVKSGGKELAEKLEAQGYDWIKETAK